MRILFLVPYPLGESPSQRFRFEQYFDLLKKGGDEISVSTFWSNRAWHILYQHGLGFEKFFWLLAGFIKRTGDLFKALLYDLIFIHRECAPIGPPLFEFIITKILRKKIIYDFDDAIWLPNTSAENSLAAWIKFHGKVKHICGWSYRVSCGNEWLANYARKFNAHVVINPTTIDTETLHNPALFPSRKAKNKIIIGWTGTHSTMVYLNAIIPALQIIEQKYSVAYRIISNKNPNLPLTNVEFISWKKETEIQDLFSFDIGLMPLTDDAWAKGKCGFKALQYMALEIPCVASPIGVNELIIESGKNGFLCSTQDEWIASLEKLIEDKSLRKNLGEAGRQTVVERFSVSSNSTNFFSLTKL